MAVGEDNKAKAVGEDHNIILLLVRVLVLVLAETSPTSQVQGHLSPNAVFNAKFVVMPNLL